MQPVIDEIHMPKHGRARTRPDTALCDKAYPSTDNPHYLCRRGITAVIPEKSDQIARRKSKGSIGGRPPTLDAELYRDRYTVERYFAVVKQWRGLTTRYDKLAVVCVDAAVLAGLLDWLPN